MTAVPTPTLLVPLRVEAIAVRSGLRRRTSDGPPAATVIRTGAGPDRSAASLAALGLRPASPPALTVVLGVCGGLDPTLRPGDLIVADGLTRPDGSRLDTDLTDAPTLAAVLRAAGLAVRTGVISGADTVVRGGAPRQALADRGALGVDLESWVLAAGGPSGPPGPVAVVRAVVDTPQAELFSPATVMGGIQALLALRRAAPVLVDWAARPRSSPLRSTAGSQ